MAKWFALLASVALCACATAPGPRDALVGFWKSDREATLAHLPPDVKPEHRALLEEILGELVMEYDGDLVVADLDGWTHIGTYEVVAEGPGFVDVRAEDLVTDEWQVHRLWVDGDRMWLWVDGIGFHEYFSRLPDRPAPSESCAPDEAGPQRSDSISAAACGSSARSRPSASPEAASPSEQ